MSVRYAATFPGQGAQYVGMAADLLETSSVAQSVFARASDALGWDVEALCIHGPEDRLNLTAFTQPAILTHSVAVWEVLREMGAPAPEWTAGLSLGEYSALVAASVLSLEDAVRLVHLRGQLMQKAVPAGVGAMAAIIGLDADQVANVCASLSVEPSGIVCGANFNCPGQVVISGHREAVLNACEELKAAGARKAVPLAVSAPFHSPLMEPAKLRLLEAMESVPFQSAAFPVISNARVEPLTKPESIRAALGEQMTASVQWEASVRWMLEQGISTWVEMGPGKTLTGFLRRIDRDATGLACENLTEVEEVLGQL